MAIVVPSSDTVNYALQAQIAVVQALVTANANPVNLAANSQLLFQLQQQLVENLMGNTNDRANYLSPGLAAGVPSFYNPATIISSGTINT